MRLVSGGEMEGSLERRSIEKLGKIAYEKEKESRLEKDEKDEEEKEAKRKSTQTGHEEG